MAANRLFSSPAFRFSIRQLLLGTALVAVGCVALRSASPMWVAALLGLTLLLLVAAVPLAIFRQGTNRAWWFGFALFGWLYMLLLAYSWSLDPNTTHYNPLRPSSLVTSRLSNLGYDRIYGGAMAQVPQTTYQQVLTTKAYPSAFTANVGVATDPYFSTGSNPIAVSYAVPVTTYQTVALTASMPTGPALDDFVNIAHAFWAVLIAVCGGWFTCWLYATRPAPAKAPSSESVTPTADSA
jgi:hypothetical protein